MIGVFDSGFGGLTILHELRKALPEYDFTYLGDTVPAPLKPFIVTRSKRSRLFLTADVRS